MRITFFLYHNNVSDHFFWLKGLKQLTIINYHVFLVGIGRLVGRYWYSTNGRLVRMFATMIIFVVLDNFLIFLLPHNRFSFLMN